MPLSSKLKPGADIFPYEGSRGDLLSLLFIPYLLRIKDLEIAEFSCRETFNNEYDDLFAEDIS